MVLVPFGPSPTSEPPITAELLGAQLRRLCPGRTDLAILDTPAGDCAIARVADQVADVGLAVLLADAGSTAVLPDYGRGALLTPLTGGEPPRYIVLNQLDRRRRLSQDIAEFLERRLESRLLGSVRYDEALAEAAAQNLTLSEDEQAQGAASDIRDMARKLQAILA